MGRTSAQTGDAEAGAPAHAVRFARDAGPIAWDPAELAACRLPPDVAQVLQVAAVLEEDTAISARQGRALGLDRTADIGAFLDVWEQEEAEHGRALGCLLAAQPYDPPPSRPGSISLRRRALVLVPLHVLGRSPVTGFVYGALGAAAEYVAIVIYTELAKRAEAPAVEALLRAIARQEGRHFSFFLAATNARAQTMSPAEGRVARWALVRIWSPVGLASLGERRWRTSLAPLLADADVRARVQRMDRVLDSIPNLDGFELMTTFLRDPALRVGRGAGERPEAPHDAGSGGVRLWAGREDRRTVQG